MHATCSDCPVLPQWRITRRRTLLAPTFRHALTSAQQQHLHAALMWRHQLLARCHCTTGQRQSLTCLDVPSELAMAALAARLATSLQRGDVYLLHGEVGAGKSVFSRAFVRAALGDPSLPVPSPTFLLHNSYELEAGEGFSEATADAAYPEAIHHYDLYRLQHESSGAAVGSFERLGLHSSFVRGVCLVEWPERLPASVQPTEYLSVHINIHNHTTAAQLPQDEHEEDDDLASPFSDQRARRVVLLAHGQRWQERLAELAQEHNPLGGCS